MWFCQLLSPLHKKRIVDNIHISSHIFLQVYKLQKYNQIPQNQETFWHISYDTATNHIFALKMYNILLLLISEQLTI